MYVCMYMSSEVGVGLYVVYLQLSMCVLIQGSVNHLTL